MALAFDRDGGLWFTANQYAFTGFQNVIGRISDGRVGEQLTIAKRQDPEAGGIAVSPEGSIWFADPRSWAVGRVAPAGGIETFSAGYGARPRDVAVGPDGRVWFTAPGSNSVGRLDAAGTVEHFSLTPGSGPGAIAAGSDGAMWVTEVQGNRIARITAAGGVTEFPLPTPDSRPSEIALAPDGSLWFTEEGGPRLGRITPSGQIAEYPVAGTRGTGPIAVADDGSVFFASDTEIGSLSPAGVEGPRGCVTFACDLPVTALTVGPDGGLWYATGIRRTGGGGGTQQLELYAPGTVGRFEFPGPVQAWVHRRPAPVRGHFTKLLIECRGGELTVCSGRVRLTTRGKRHLFVGRSSFLIKAGVERLLALRVGRAARTLIAHRGWLRVTARTAVAGGPEASQDLVLRPAGRGRKPAQN